MQPPERRFSVEATDRQKKTPGERDVSTIRRGYCVSVKPNPHIARGVKGAKTQDYRSPT